MTICIAAIGKGLDGKELIVFATDHMVSTEQIGQFEVPVCKYRELANNNVAMLAGDPLIFDRLTENCLRNSTHDQAKANIHKNMGTLRSEVIQKVYLDVFQIDYEYIQAALQGERTKRLRRKLINRYQQSSSALPPQS